MRTRPYDGADERLRWYGRVRTKVKMGWNDGAKGFAARFCVNGMKIGACPDVRVLKSVFNCALEGTKLRKYASAENAESRKNVACFPVLLSF